MLIHERIRERRKALGLNQEKLSELTGISQSQISRYEQGDNDPTGESLIALARVLHTSTDYLLGVTDDPIPPQDRSDLNQQERQIIAALRRGDRMEAVKIISMDQG